MTENTSSWSCLNISRFGWCQMWEKESERDFCVCSHYSWWWLFAFKGVKQHHTPKTLGK